MYTVKRYDIVSGEWHYFNTFATYSEAAEARDMLTRRFGGKFEIFER